jgi:hypothetical protein
MTRLMEEPRGGSTQAALKDPEFHVSSLLKCNSSSMISLLTLFGLRTTPWLCPPRSYSHPFSSQVWIRDLSIIIEFYFKSCRSYSSRKGSTRTGGKNNPATSFEFRYLHMVELGLGFQKSRSMDTVEVSLCIGLRSRI